MRLIITYIKVLMAAVQSVNLFPFAPVVEADLENGRCVSVKVCAARATHTVGMPGHSVDVCLRSVSVSLCPLNFPAHVPMHLMHMHGFSGLM